MKKYLLPIVLITSFLGTAVSAQVFRGGGSSGTTCPSGSQYKGNGFCSSSDGKQFFRGGGNSGTACPLAVITKGMGSANQMTTSNSSLREEVDRLVPLVVNTKGMVSAEATKF